MKNLIITSILLLLGLAAPQTTLWGTHIRGLEISHEVVGPYIIKLKARYYVDRAAISPGSNIIFLVNFGQPNSTSVHSGPPTLIPYNDGLCQQASTNVGLNLYEYETTWNIPQHLRDIRLAIGVSIREVYAGMNIQCGQETYVETVYNPLNLSGQTLRNITAQYSTPPRIAFAAGQFHAFHLPMIDRDGDSLAYSMVPPRINPVNQCSYQPPFSSLQPLGPNNVVFDSIRGTLSILPNVSPGCYRVAFWTREYRNGVLIGESMQDYSLCFYNSNPQTTRPRPATQFVTDIFMSPLAAPIVEVPPTVPNMPSIYVDYYPCEGNNDVLVLNIQDAPLPQTTLTTDISTQLPGGLIEFLPVSGVNPTDAFVVIDMSNAVMRPTTFSIILEKSSCPANTTFQIFVNIKKVTRRNTILASRQTICPGVNNAILLDAPQGSMNSTYLWSPPALFSSSSSPNQVINISAPTTVYVTVSSGPAGCEVTDSLTIVTAQQAIQLTQLDSCWGVPVRFRASTGQLNGTYRWSPSNLFAGQTGNVATANLTQPTDIGITYTDVAGCTASSSLLGASLVPLGITVTADQTLLCMGDTVRLSALMSGDSLTSRPNLNQYDVSAIPVTPINTAGFTTISLTDDSYSSNIPLGFAFTYFGYRYDSCFISSNGFITFGSPRYDLGNAPLPHPTAPSNMIALAWGDLDPGIGGSISYATQGTAPNRKFIIRYDQVPFYGNPNAPGVSGFIVLYESTNVIDIISTNIQHNNSNLTQGIQNSNGTIAFTVPGRNMDLWNASFNAYRFTNTTLFEHEPNFGYAWTNVPTLQPYPNNPYHIVTQNTTYTVTATNPGGCNVTGSVSVAVRPRTSSTSASNMICGLPNGTATATGGANYFWNNGATTPQITGLSAGRYIVNIIEPNGCDFSDTLNILNPFLSASQSLSVTQTSPPSCSPATVTFGASVTSQLPGTFDWLPISVFGNQSGPSASAVLNEPTHVTLVYSEQVGCSITRTILSNNSNNNLSISASANSVCAGGSVTLNSFRGGDSGDFSGRSYSVNNIPYQPVTPNTPINCTITAGSLDDGFSLVNLGFPFTYFGQTYTQAYVGTNGFLSFGLGSNSFSPSTIPNPSSTPNNAIYLVWGDLYANSSSMRYETLGTAPNRRFVLYFSNEDLAANFIPQVGQIVLYEGTNEIDIISTDINYGYGTVQGIENATGTYALPVPGRNFTTFTARSDAYRFTPIMDTITNAGYRYRWSGLSNGSVNYLNNVTTTVSQNSVFTVTSYDPLGCAVTGTVSVNTIPRQSSISSTPETCNGQDGTATASGGTAYQWPNGSTSASATGLSSGFNYVTITEPNGCVIPDSVFIGSSFGLAWGIQTSNANCQATDGTAMVNPPSSGSPFAVSWSNGSTGNSVSGLAPGWYSATISNASGCRSHRNFEIRENSNCFWRIEGYVYNDHVTPDCTTDASSNNISNAIIQVSDNSGNAIGYAVTDSTGFYSYDVRNAGRSYNLDYLVPNYANAIAACPNTLTVSITASQRVSTGNNFYVDYIEQNDAEAVAYMPRMRIGLNNPFTPFVQNMGNTFLSGTFTLTYSANLIYTGSQNGVIVNPSNRTVTLPFSNLRIGSSQSLPSFFTPATSAAVGDPFSLTGIVQINGTDTNPANDTFRVDGVIVNSYDPNEKSVFPQGSGPEHGILESQRKLTYNIDFENLGNDTAYAVLIHDVIDTTKLDIRSVRPIASSHDFEMGIKGLDTLTFHFQDINLLARSQDPQKAKGFVAFSIDLKPGLPVGTRIENRASIFFDYNAAIVTNAAFNTIVRPSGIEAPTLSLSAKLFPNPTNANATLEIDLEEGTELRISVLDMMGRAVGNSQQSTWLPEGRHQFVLDSEQWPAGMYFVQLVTPKGVVALPMQVAR